MRFILKMARREIRSSWRRLLFFFVCIAIGVGAIVALRSAIRNFNRVMVEDARSILSADVQIDSSRPWSKETLETLNRLLKPPHVEARIETVEVTTMLRPADATQEGAMMVELKGIEAPFPLYGEIQLTGAQPFSHGLLADHGVLVARAVLERLNLKVGDRVKIGEKVFRIRGGVVHEPGGGIGFRFGPRVILDRNSLETAGLTGFGSRVRRRILLKAPEAEVGKLVKLLRKELKTKFVNVRSYRESQENLDRQLARAENFLSLTGLIILVLGGIGITSVTRVFIEQKRKAIAVLKCVGATGRKIISAYLTQILALGLAGSLVGIGLAKGTLYFTARYYSASLPENMSYGLQTAAVAQGIGVGLLITLLFSALPLLRIRHIKPNVLLRDETERPPYRLSPLALRFSHIDLPRWCTAVLVTAGLALVASWQAGSFRIGLFFLLGLLATAAALHLAAMLLVRIVRRLKPFSSFSVRHAISSLYRPGNQTQVIVMAVGLGVFFIAVTQSLKLNLLHELDFDRRTNMADMYLIDVQEDQKDGVDRIVKKATGKAADLIPTMRGRISAINGKELNPESDEFKRDRRRLRFEYTLTYRSGLEINETIIAGKFWDPIPSAEPEVSIEESLKGMMGLDVGGMITFDILGREIAARVTSIRHVDWRNSRTGFYVIFRPGTLEKAPHSYIAAIDAPAEEPDRSRFQRILVDQYPNVTAIDAAEIVRGVRKVLHNVSIAVSFIGLFVFLSGALILIGSIAMTKFQRVYEAAILKTLGAKRSIILVILMIEYGLLGIVSGIVGSLAAIGLSYAVTHFVFEIPWYSTPSLYLTATAATVFLVTGVGAISSLDVLNRKPLATLRAQ